MEANEPDIEKKYSEKDYIIVDVVHRETGYRPPVDLQLITTIFQNATYRKKEDIECVKVDYSSKHIFDENGRMITIIKLKR